MFVETLIAALALGAIVGFAACTVFVADPLRRSRNVLRDRVISEQLRAYAADARLTAFRLMSERERVENGQHSMKAAPLEVVR